MPEAWLWVGIFLLVVTVMCIALLLLGSLLRPSRPSTPKSAPYESSVPTPFGDARARYSARFYIIAVLFVLAGLCEIGGGYLVWQWLRNQRGILWGALGGIVLFLYGVIPTLQPSHFSRVYAAYGGVFVVLSLAWGWLLDGQVPDRFDVAGAVLCLAGVALIMYAPRG